MSQLNRRTVIAATTALGVSTILPARVYAQTVPEIQTLRSTSKSWLWAAEDYANSRGFFDKARVKVVSNASNRGTNVAALAMALKEINASPPEFRAWADKWFEGLPPEIASTSFDINSKIFFANPLPKENFFQSNVDFLNTVQKTMNAAPLPATLTFKDMYDTTVAQEALSRL